MALASLDNAPTGERTALYRHYDDSGSLLYVGVSLNAVIRLAQHKQASDWFNSITRVDIEFFESRQKALSAETEAIQEEGPAHNIRKKGAPEILEDPTRAAESRRQLLHRIVNFEPVYSLSEAARALYCSEDKIKSMCKEGVLGCCVVSKRKMANRWNKGGPDITIVKRIITGWQIIDYLEFLSRED